MGSGGLSRRGSGASKYGAGPSKIGGGNSASQRKWGGRESSGLVWQISLTEFCRTIQKHDTPF